MPSRRSITEIGSLGNSVLGIFGTDNFENLSFETPGGLPANVLSSNSEPFHLADGMTLVLRALGGDLQEFEVDAADYADVDNATAAEVAAALNSNLSGVWCADATGALSVSSQETGASAQLEIVSGTLLDVVLLEAGTYYGYTDPGQAWRWTISENEVAGEVAEFDEYFVQTVEDFEEQWGADDVAGLHETDLEAAEFESSPAPANTETFEVEWGSYTPEMPGTESASFTAHYEAAGVLSYEDFEAFPDGNLEPAATFEIGTTDSGAEEDEDFEEGWGSLVADWDDVTSESATFDGEDFEDFEETTLVYKVVTVHTVHAGPYKITINGTPAVYVADGMEATNDIADELAQAVNNSGVPMTATAVGSTVELQHENPGTPVVIVVDAELPSSISAAFPDRDTLWIGSDHLPS